MERRKTEIHVFPAGSLAEFEERQRLLTAWGEPIQRLGNSESLSKLDMEPDLMLRRMNARMPMFWKTASMFGKSFPDVRGIGSQISIELKPRVHQVQASALADVLAMNFQARFACVHQLADQEIAELRRLGLTLSLDREGHKRCLNVPSQKVGQRIPYLFWRTVVGMTFVDRIGRERLENLPAMVPGVQMRHFGPGLVAVQLTESLADYAGKDFDLAQTRREAVKAYLGKEHFL